MKFNYINHVHTTPNPVNTFTSMSQQCNQLDGFS